MLAGADNKPNAAYTSFLEVKRVVFSKFKSKRRDKNIYTTRPLCLGSQEAPVSSYPAKRWEYVACSFFAILISIDVRSVRDGR